MNRGGAENALMNYYRHVDRNCIQFDFLLRPPSLATNKVIPKQIRKAPVVISTLYKSAR